MFTEEEISAAKATRDALVNGEMPQELKSIYMAGEICMWDDLGRPSNPKEPEAVHGNEAEKEVCMEAGCQKIATKDYNGHGHMVCESHYNSLNDFFDSEYK